MCLALLNNWLGSEQVKFSKGTDTQFFYECVHVTQSEISNSHQRVSKPPGELQLKQGGDKGTGFYGMQSVIYKSLSLSDVCLGHMLNSCRIMCEHVRRSETQNVATVLIMSWDRHLISQNGLHPVRACDVLMTPVCHVHHNFQPHTTQSVSFPTCHLKRQTDSCSTDLVSGHEQSPFLNPTTTQLLPRPQTTCGTISVCVWLSGCRTGVCVCVWGGSMPVMCCQGST